MSIRLQNVTKQYKDGKTVFSALSGISLAVEEGKTIAIVGPSGSGKSTLLHLIGGLDKPTSGRVEVSGRELGAMKDRDLARFRNRTVGFVFQFFNLLPHASALDNVLLPFVYNGRIVRNRRQYGIALLEKIGLGGKLKNKPTELSGGEQQRVAIARALINDPAIILADEPTGNLDSKTGEEIMKLLLSFRDLGKTLVIVTHDTALASRADKVIHMKDGKIV
jgi:putative ABC transport system ATP-binding protein